MRTRLRRSKWLLACISLILLLLTAGCTLPSSGTTFPEPEEKPETVSLDARTMLETAVTTTSESKNTQKFWFTGHIKNSIQQRTTTSMYEGVVNRHANAYLVNGKLATQQYQYYSWGDTKYIRKGEVWFRAGKEDVQPFDPFGGFTDWLPLLKDAQQLPDDAILSKPTNVIQVKISAEDWAQKSTSPLFADLKNKMAAHEATREILRNGIVKMTLWIGKDDNIIYQYSTWIVMPLPGAGYFDQETFFRFYRYNDPEIDNQLQPPDKIEEWVKKVKKMNLDDME